MNALATSTGPVGWQVSGTVPRDIGHIPPNQMFLATAAALMLASLGWSWQGRLSIGPRDVVSHALLWGAMLAWGPVLLRLCRAPRRWRHSYPARLVAGFAAFSLPLVGARLVLGAPLIPTALAWAAAGAVLNWRTAERCPAPPRAELWAVLLALAAASAYVQHYLPAQITNDRQVILPGFRDHYTHALFIELVSTGSPLQLGRIGLARESIPFYHFAGYAAAAVLHQATGQIAYDIVFVYLVPLALTLVALTAYVLGTAWGGSRAGLISLLVVSVLPDPSYWTLGLFTRGVYLYSFDHFIQFAPANAFGIAVLGLALALAIDAIDLLAAAAAFALALCGIWFKAQVCAVAIPLIGLLCAWHTLRNRNIRPAVRIGFAAGSLLLLLALVVLVRNDVPSIAFERPPAQRYTEYLYASTCHDTAAAALSAWVVDNGGPLTIAGRALLMLFLPWRWTLIAWPFLPSLRRSAGLGLELVTAAALAIYLAAALFLAPNKPEYHFGTPWNFQQVPFTWTYCVVGCWMGVRIADGLNRFNIRSRAIEWAAIILVACATWIGRQPLNVPTLVEERWAYASYPSDLISCAAYLRQTAAPNELFLDSENDAYYLVEALAERRAWVSWNVVATYTTETAVDAVFRRRIAEHAELRALYDPARIARWARDRGIRWYLLEPHSRVNWSPGVLNHPVYRAGDYRVYDLLAFDGELAASAR